MAGIEKICEFSGEYPGDKMYQYKRNLIQIMPKYMKLFRGADAELIITAVNDYYLWPEGFGCNIDQQSCDHENRCNETSYTYKEYLKNYEKITGFTQGRFVKEYWFTLKVKNPELQGKVQGEYSNWTFNLRQTKKRLKRMLRCRELKVKYAESV